MEEPKSNRGGSFSFGQGSLQGIAMVIMVMWFQDTADCNAKFLCSKKSDTEHDCWSMCLNLNALDSCVGAWGRNFYNCCYYGYASSKVDDICCCHHSSCAHDGSHFIYYHSEFLCGLSPLSLPEKNALIDIHICLHFSGSCFAESSAVLSRWFQVLLELLFLH